MTAASGTGGKSAARVFAVLATLCAVLLFAYALRQAGAGEVLGVIARLGWWFAGVVLLAGLRLSVRAEGWRQCFEHPAGIGFRRAWSGHVVGTGIGYLVPVGFAFGEALKATSVRDRVPFAEALAAVAIANLFYALSLASFVIVGTCVLLAVFELPPALLTACRLTVAVACICAAGPCLCSRGRAEATAEQVGSASYAGGSARRIGSQSLRIKLMKRAAWSAASARVTRHACCRSLCSKSVSTRQVSRKFGSP